MRKLLFVALLLAVAFAGVGRDALRAGTACTRKWQASTVPPVPNGLPTALNGVAAVSRNDVWAVGQHGVPEHTLIEHWDGRSWRMAISPPGVLSGIAAHSSHDVWAVGTTTTTARKSRPLIEHWDGRRWKIMQGANAPASQLYGVAAVSPTDVWAVGGSFSARRVWSTFVEHWDGHRWTQVPSPADQTPLDGLVALSADDVWAVGWSVGENGDHEGIQHWDGSSWSVALTRRFRDGGWYPSLSGVAGTSRNDIWAVGNAAAGPLAEHWNGSDWRPVPIPFAHFASRARNKVDSALGGVVALSPTNVWAVGFGMEHWNGRSFTVSNVTQNADLHDVSAVSANDLWAVGEASYQPLALHYACVK
jgi:hypothetical protein